MSETLKDGRGTGNRAQVDEDGRLRTHATALTAMAHASKSHGRAFSIPALNYSLSTADQEYNLVWVRNDDPEYNMHINRFYIGWNGGDTNHNRTLDCRMYVGTPEPTANNTSFNLGNLNFTSSRESVTTNYLWDGVGNGLTVAAQGTKAIANYFSQGTTTIEVDGTIVVGYGQAIMLTATPEEAGDVSLIASVWFTESGD